MANENTLIGQLEQEFLNRLNNSLIALQDAQEMFVDTINKLEEHNIEMDSHLDIRQMIIELQVGAGFLTPEVGQTQVNAALQDHNIDEQSHPDLRSVLMGLRNTVDEIDVRLRAIEPHEGDEALTELEYRLRLIDEYYDPILEALLQAWQVASMQGSPNADNIADEYQDVLNQKAQARADVLREFQYE